MGTITKIPETNLWTKVQQLEADMREQLASQAAAFNGTVATLNQTVADLSAQVAFLSGQITVAEASPPAPTYIERTNITANVSITWLPFDASADASLTITSSSTGLVLGSCGGYVGLDCNGYNEAQGFIGCELLDATGAHVWGPANGDGNMGDIFGDGVGLSQVSTGQPHVWTVPKNQVLTFRCRRGYSLIKGNATNWSRITFQGTALSVTKMGM